MPQRQRTHPFEFILEELPMKTSCCIFILTLILGIAPSRLSAQGGNAAKGALTNQDVVDLVKTGLSDDIVVAKIKGSSCQFDTSPASLKDLKTAGISDAVILAMVQASSSPAGTATSATSDPVSSDPFAYIRVYRLKQVPGSNFTPPIFVDDKQIAEVGNGRRVTIKVTPGPHMIKSDDKTGISINAKGGQEFYISIQELPGGFLKGRGKLTMVANEQGKPEYAVTKPVEEARKVDKDAIEDDVETPDSASPGSAAASPAAK
jgi:hypothetical protein